MISERLKVLYVTGFGRSGTTILDNILGQIDGIFAAGELHYIWDRSLDQNRLCACGRAFGDCPIWQKVMATYTAEHRPDLVRLAELREGLTPRQALVNALTSSPPSADRTAYASAMESLYHSIAASTGSQVIVDSSKSPAWGQLLDQMPSIEPHVVHLIRDPRAVAFSWLKKVVYDPGGEEPMYMTQHSPARSARLWMVWNLTAELIWRRRKDRYLRVRYEDFADRPRETLESVTRLVLDEVPQLPFSGERDIQLVSNHSMAGNPSRFKTGKVTVRRDDTWREGLSPSHRRLVSFLTLPLALRYGY